MFNSIVCFSPFPPHPPKSPNLENRLIVSAHEQRKPEGAKGLAGRSCHVSACLHLLCRTCAHLYSRHRQAVTRQPSLSDQQPLSTSSPHAAAATPRAAARVRGVGAWGADLLDEYLIRMYYFITIFWLKYWNPPKVKWVVPMKYNKTHFWKCSLCLSVVSKLLPLTFIVHSFAAPHKQYNKTI